MKHVLSRRVLVQGTAWTVPVVSIAVATPALAASSGCPSTVTFTGDINGAGLDQLTVTNTGTTPIPAGTTLTWELQNVSGATRTYSFVLTGLSLTLGTSPVTVANGSSTTLVFTVTTAIPPGGTRSWTVNTGSNKFSSYRYNSMLTLGPTCTALCLSDNGTVTNTFGTTCPTGSGARAGSAKSSAQAVPEAEEPRRTVSP